MCLLVCQTLSAQMTPNKPIKNFKLPRLADNGYTQWVLQGGKGTYEGAEQVLIEEMGLRVYTGDERMALEMTMDSPEATVLIKENKAYSESTIEIVGSNFKISGVGWTWDGATKEIEVLFDTVVKFTQDLSDSFGADAQPDSEAAPQTVIHSRKLKLTTSEKDYRFEFSTNVHVASGDMDLRGNLLIALVDAPEGRKKDRPKLEVEELDAVRQIIAREEVVITQKGRVVRAGEAEFLPREKKVNLAGNPSIEASGGYLSGHSIRSQEGEVVVLGSEDSGRAQMILTETGGLGIQGGAALGEETIVLADSIIMRELEEENQFLFDGSVVVMSGAVQMSSDRMKIFTEGESGEPASDVTSDEASKIKVGDVRQMVADGSVRIEQDGQVATCDLVTFYPDEERAVLEGNPKVTNGEAVVLGEKMELQPGLAIVRGNEEQPVNVVLPVLPDLGYDGFAATDTPEADPEVEVEVETEVEGIEPTELAESEEAEPAPQETIVQSQLLRMLEQPERTVFRFTENVTINGTNLKASCDQLDVIAVEKKTQDTESGDFKERLALQRIEAIDQVVIEQDGRTATADKAFILPEEGKVVLEGNAEIIDPQGKVSGHRMTLMQGQRRAIVEGGGEDNKRATITLPALPTGKF